MLEHFLVNFVEAHRLIAYAVIFFIILVEGEVVLLIAGALSHKRFLDFFDLLFFASIGVILHDMLYWWIGKKLGERGAKKFLFIDFEKVMQFFDRFRGREGLYIFISKFVWGFNRLALVGAGHRHMQLKKILPYSIPAALIWTTLLTSLGYFFAYQTDILKKDLKTAALLIGTLVLCFILLEEFIKKLVKRKIGVNGNP